MTATRRRQKKVVDIDRQQCLVLGEPEGGRVTLHLLAACMKDCLGQVLLPMGPRFWVAVERLKESADRVAVFAYALPILHIKPICRPAVIR